MHPETCLVLSPVDVLDLADLLVAPEVVLEQFLHPRVHRGLEVDHADQGGLATFVAGTLEVRLSISSGQVNFCSQVDEVTIQPVQPIKIC